MRKTKVEDKSEKSFDSFFESETTDENNSLSFTNNSNTLRLESNENFTKQTNSFLNLLKQILFFLPGTFLLYFLGFVSATLLMNVFIFLPPDTLPPSEPVEILGITSTFIQIILLGTLGVLGVFMTWFGLGDIKNKKHFSIPLSIIFTGAIIALFVKAIKALFGGGFIEEFDKYFIYLLPLILIIPILIKGLVDRKTE